MPLVDDDIVISGIGSHLPKSSNIEEFQQHLYSNESMIGSRWPAGDLGVTNALGTMKTKDLSFDFIYFRILRQQSVYMDPMHGLALERTFEALIDAGVNPLELKGKNVGCFMGSSIGEEDNLYVEATAGGYGITGHCRAMLPNRISYWLDIHGPSLNFYVNWVSGIEIIQTACEAIRSGRCESAIVGTTTFSISAKFNWIFSDMGLLSPDGVTRPFDADANGYARSEGIVVFYIQKASDAKRSYATILKATTLYNGARKGPLLHIDEHYLTNYLADFYKDCPVKPEEVDYLETYGCGIKEVDVKELNAMEKIYCKNRKEPLKIGATKSVTGHAEASSSLVSIITVILAMENGMIPATINYNKPNPDIAALHNGSMEVVTKNTKWDGKYAAVSVLGLGSTYGHILLKANTKQKIPTTSDLPRLAIVSSRTEEGIQEILNTIRGRPNVDAEYIHLIQEFFSKPTSQHIHRGFIVAGNDNETKEETRVYQGVLSPIWFVYSGMGSQWNNMIGDLMNIPIIANSINKSHQVLLEKGVNLIEILTSKDPTVFDNILHCFIGIAAIQIALTDVLEALDIVPDGIIGHSVGELGCAYADKCVTAEQMILAAYYRGKASQEATLIKGIMAAVGLGYNKIKTMLPPKIEVACHNGPDSCTISGPEAEMKEFVQKLQDDGVFARLVNVANIAYHSQYIRPAAPILLNYLKKVLPEPVARSSKWISTSNAEENWDTDLAKHSSADYHTNNLLSSVLFEEGLKHIPKNAVLIEIAPHGLLQAILKRSCKPGCINVALTYRGSEKNTEVLLMAIGKLYLSGLTMKVSNLYPKIEYPVSKGTPSLANLSHWEQALKYSLQMDELIKPPGAIDLQGILNTPEFRHCPQHQIKNNMVVSVGTFLKILIDIIERIQSGKTEYVFEDMVFVKPLIISETKSIPVNVMIHKGTGNFEIGSGEEIYVKGRLTFPYSGETFMEDPITVELNKNSVQVLPESDIYNEFELRGHKYTGLFHKLKKIETDKNGSVATVEWSDWMTLIEAMIQQQLLQHGEKTQAALEPKTIVRIAMDFNALPKENEKEAVIHYDFTKNLLTTSGIDMYGFTSKVSNVKMENLMVNSIELVPLNNSLNKNSFHSIYCALQIVLQNSDNKMQNNIHVTEISEKVTSSSLIQDIENALKLKLAFTYKIAKVRSTNAVNISSSAPHLIVAKGNLTNELANLICDHDEFLLIKSTKELLFYKNLVEVFTFDYKGINYSLIRKTNELLPSFITINKNTLCSNDLSDKSLTWVKELDLSVAQKTDKKIIILVANVFPTDGIFDFLQNLSNSTSIHSIHLLFLLNSKLNQNSEEINKIIKQNLTVTVLKDNDFGTILPIAANVENVNNILSNVNSKYDYKYLGLNTNALANEWDLSYLDYTALENGKPIMGVAQFNQQTSSFEVDPIFKFEVPHLLKLDTATSIPSTYINACYALIVKAKIEIGDTVFISSGHTTFGQAALSIASYYRCIIYTNVDTIQQKRRLLKNFREINEQNIFCANIDHIEPFLMDATEGNGLEIVINNLPGTVSESLLRTLNYGGRFVQVQHPNAIDNIGMIPFAKHTQLAIVNFSSIYKLCDETKKNLKKILKENLFDLVVRPQEVVPLKNLTIKEAEEIAINPCNKLVIEVTKDNPLDKILCAKSMQFTCKQNHSYLVYGGKSNEICTMVEWLILREAKKIVVANKQIPTEKFVQRQLNIFRTTYQCEINFVEVKTDKSGTEDLLKNIKSLHGVFVLPQESIQIGVIRSILETKYPNTILVDFNSNVDEITNKSAKSSYYNVQWQSSLTFTEAVSHLDKIVNLRIQNACVSNSTIAVQQTEIQVLQTLDQMMPDINDFLSELENVESEPKFKQLLNWGNQEIRESQPIFIIPGLSGQQEIADFSFNLLYPVFKAVLPSKPLSLKETARILAKRMQEIEPRKVYNIVGISLGGPLMIEIARLLDDAGASLHLFLIDSAPEILKNSINYLGEKENEIETNLLRKIFKIMDLNLISNLTALNDWNQRVNLVIKQHDLNANRDKLQQALDIVKNYVDEVRHFSSNSKLISGRIHLIRPHNCSKFDNCGLVEYCQQLPQVQLIEGNHVSIIKNEDTVKYISVNHYVI